MSGIYTGMSGMITNEVNLSITGNNIANSKTNSYKYDVGVNRVFEESYIHRLDKNNNKTLGRYDNQVTVDEKHKVFKSGFAQPTNRQLDVYLNDNSDEENFVSFFNVESNGEMLLTRDGRFFIDEAGNLTNSSGQFILNENGNKINIGNNKPNEILFDESGNLVNANNGDVIDKIFIQSIPEGSLQTLNKVGSNSYRLQNNTQTIDGQFELYQGYLETSNVDVNREMINLISAQKGYSMNSKSFQTFDKVLDLESNKLAR